MRMKFEFGTENVKAVWFGEIDFATWGDTSGVAGRNQGGALGGDSINIESKNVYLWFKIPDTSLDFTVGLQNVTDDYAGVLYGAADMAGVMMGGKFEPVKFRLGGFKLYENSTDKANDATLYTASVKFVLGKDSSLGLNFDFLQDDTGTDPVDTKINPLDNTAANPATWANRQLQIEAVHPRRQRGLQSRPGDPFGVRLLPVGTI